MKLVKKISSVLLAACMVLALVSCSQGVATSSAQESQQASSAAVSSTASKQESVPAQKAAMQVFTLKGPTGMGMAKLMSDNDAKTAANDYTFTLCAAPTEIVAAITSGEADIAACPVNLASTLYAKTNGEVEILAVNTLGVMYVLDSTGEIKSIADLKGKTVYTSGQGSSPEYVVNEILSKNGLDPTKDVNLVYLSEHSEVATKAIAGEAPIVILPEPNVTAVLAQSSAFSIALDLTQEWDKFSDTTLVQGCVIVRKSYLAQNAQAVVNFMQEYQNSVVYVNENTDDASTLIEKYEIMAKAALAKKAIPNCNITFLAGEEMKAVVADNLQVLYDANPSAVGGKLPGDDFYYIQSK